jgi:hypothetical protein
MMRGSEAGKGDTPRPRQVSREEYDIRYELAFGKLSDEQAEKMKARLTRIRRQQHRRQQQ